MSEYEESAGQETPAPSGNGNSEGPDTEPLRPRRAGAAKTAAAVGGAVTSRTAGWMVAAALAGSLVTLGIDHGTSQPSAGSITVRNAGRVAQAPAGASKHGRIEAVPPGQKRIYVAPSGPLGAVAPPAQGRTSWIMQSPCAFAGMGGPPFSERHQGFATIMPKRVVIGARGQHKLHVQIGQVPARQAIRLARPGCSMFPIHCQASMAIGGQVPPFVRVQIERHGRVYVIGPQQGSMRRMTINGPGIKRAVVVVPAPRIRGPVATQCLAFQRPSSDWRS